MFKWNDNSVVTVATKAALLQNQLDALRCFVTEAEIAGLSAIESEAEHLHQPKIACCKSYFSLYCWLHWQIAFE
jgi:hypothetical protein